MTDQRSGTALLSLSPLTGPAQPDPKTTSPKKGGKKK